MMGLYIVTWPDLSASLVSAKDETALFDTLDEVDDPSHCTWSPYDGPVWIDFDLPRKPGPVAEDEDPSFDAQAIVDAHGDGERVGGIHACCGPDSETQGEMLESVATYAWPHLSEVLDRDTPPTIRQVQAALRKDAEKRPGPPAAQVAMERWYENLRAAAAKPPAGGKPPRPRRR
jgi:hypothetical protein